MKKYIHYGHDNFDKTLFQHITNRWLTTKPNGGLWASDIKAKFGWKDWCRAENFCNCNKNNAFTFNLKEDAKILEINSVGDLEGLPQLKTEFPMLSWILLDFEALSEKYDAVELNISNDSKLYWKLYGWDCDSILIMNPDIIVVEGE